MNIRDFESKTYSQRGEDGILAELIARLQPPKYFIEIGTGPGTECNCRLLAEREDWGGRFIEARQDCWMALCALHRDRLERIWCMNGFVTLDSIGEDMMGVAPHQVGVLSIDIDGNDSYIWEAICHPELSSLLLRPWIVCIEVNHHKGDVEYRMPYDENYCWDGYDPDNGTSLPSMNALAETLGYTHVGTTTEGVNSFYVRADLAGRLGE